MFHIINVHYIYKSTISETGSYWIQFTSQEDWYLANFQIHSYIQHKNIYKTKWKKTLIVKDTIKG